MNENYEAIINNNWVVSKRGKKNVVDHHLPYDWSVEKERTISGKIEDTAIIFLQIRNVLFIA